MAGSSPSVAVIGAGAIGTWLAARCAQAGCTVSVVARGGRLAEIRNEGLLCRLSREEILSGVVATDHLGHVPAPDIVIIATKTNGLDDAIAQIVSAVVRPQAILTVQNGVEAPYMVQAAVPEAEVVAARVHGFFEMDGAAVRHVGVEPSIGFGSVNGAGGRGHALLGEVLAAARIEALPVSDVAAMLWEKLVLTSSLGGVGAMLDMSVGTIRSDPGHWRMLDDAMNEVAAVARARGVALPEDCVARTLEFVSTFPDDARSSLNRDLRSNRPSEFAHLTGAIPRLAAPFGVKVPVHQLLVQRLTAEFQC